MYSRLSAAPVLSEAEKGPGDLFGSRLAAPSADASRQVRILDLGV